MRLIKLKDGSYLNPEKVNLIKATTGFRGEPQVVIKFDGEHKDDHIIYVDSMNQAEEYLEELADSCQETSEIMNRLDRLETDIRYLPGGPEYQKAAQNYESLLKETENS